MLSYMQEEDQEVLRQLFPHQQLFHHDSEHRSYHKLLLLLFLLNQLIPSRDVLVEVIVFLLGNIIDIIGFINRLYCDRFEK